MQPRIIRPNEFVDITNIRDRINFEHLVHSAKEEPQRFDSIDAMISAIQTGFMLNGEEYLTHLQTHGMDVKPVEQITYLARELGGLIQLLPMYPQQFVGEFGFVQPLVYNGETQFPAKCEIIPGQKLVVQDNNNICWNVQTYVSGTSAISFAKTRLEREVGRFLLSYGMQTQPGPMGLDQSTDIDLLYSTDGRSSDAQTGRLVLSIDEFADGTVSELSLRRAQFSHLEDDSYVYLDRNDGQLKFPGVDYHAQHKSFEQIFPQYEGIPILDEKQTIANAVCAFTQDPSQLDDNKYVAFKQRDLVG